MNIKHKNKKFNSLLDSAAELWLNLVLEQIKNKNKKENKYETTNA